MPEQQDDNIDAQAERMLEAAMGGLTPREALLAASRSDPEAKAAAIAKNRERALRLLAEIEKTLD